jgi:hypothetical protein
MAAMMPQRFELRWRGELTVLEALFGKEKLLRDLPRVREIHEYTELKWNEYADQLRDRVVHYLLIGEAPPWSPEGTPQFLLDPKSRVRTLMQALRKVFPTCELPSGGDHLKALAAHGSLLVDSIPFAMDYSSKRSSRGYDDLVRLTATSYLQWKINSSALSWTPDIRIAFFVERNARSILKAVEQLSIGGRWCPLSSQMIAVNDAGYADADKLRIIYGLNVDPPFSIV